MTQLRICLFRPFQAAFTGHNTTCLDAQKVKELFCYLLLYRHRPHLREHLTTLLWSDANPDQGRKYLRQTLWQLQTCLETAEAEPLLLLSDNCIQINPRADLWLDVQAFETAFTCVQGRRGRELDAAHAAMLRDLLPLYQGDLLEGCYLDWCLFERERLQNIYLAMLDKLMGYCETHQLWDEGISYGIYVLRVDTARERTHRRLMRLHYLAGDRTAALRQYESCQAALAKELGVAPARQTTHLNQQICNDELDDPGLTPRNPGKDTLPDLLQAMMALRATLHNFQCHIEREIDQIRLAIHHPDQSA